MSHVHLIAIGGVGMSSLAGMFKERGFRVTGSDQALYPPADRLLARLQIPVSEGYRRANLDPRPDFVVIGNAISRGNPEAEAVLADGIPYYSFPQALAEFFLAGKRRLVVAGTHGKSTSCAMLAWILTHAGRSPSFMIGAACRNFGANYRLGEGPEFVVEGDEYDSAFFDKGPKFLHYDPDLLLLTAVEYDHADIYADLSAVKEAFRRLLRRMRPQALVIGSADFPEVADVVAGRDRVETFGMSPSSLWRGVGLVDDGSRTKFTVIEPDGSSVEISLSAPGRMNAANALGAYAAARKVGVDSKRAAEALRCFEGVERRQQVVAEADGIVLIDDFAHHPTAVAETLAALRHRYPGRRLWVLFEPRSNTSRRSVFQQEFAAALAGADRVIIGRVYKEESLQPNERLSTRALAESLERRAVAAEVAQCPQEIAERVRKDAKPGDVITIMSNGAFGGLREMLIAVLGVRGRSESTPLGK